MRPTGVEATWDDTVPWFQAMLLAYEQVRQIEEAKRDTIIAGGKWRA